MLGHVRVGSTAVALRDFLGFARGGEQDHGNVLRSLVGPYLLQYPEAVRSGQVFVQQDERRGAPLVSPGVGTGPE